MFPTDYAIEPGELARLAEDRGFESLFFPEHTHIPVGARRRTPAAASCRGSTAHTLRPVRRPDRGRGGHRAAEVGTGICLVVERDPITTAKEVASVDRLSGGRLLFGVGAGWNLEEMRTTAPTRPRASGSCASGSRR